MTAIRSAAALVGATFLIVILVLPAGLYAQNPDVPNGCALCGIVSYIDTPTDSGDGTRIPIVDGAAGWWIAGWGFQCYDGTPVDRVEVWYSRDDGFYEPVRPGNAVLYTGVLRPDVSAWSASTPCHVADSATGFGLFLKPGAVPAGTRLLRINVWRGPYFATIKRTVIVQGAR